MLDRRIVRGSGGERNRLLIGQPNLFDVASVVYRFESSESPVPEPATLLMLGAGLVILSNRMRRRV